MYKVGDRVILTVSINSDLPRGSSVEVLEIGHHHSGLGPLLGIAVRDLEPPYHYWWALERNVQPDLSYLSLFEDE